MSWTDAPEPVHRSAGSTAVQVETLEHEPVEPSAGWLRNAHIKPPFWRGVKPGSRRPTLPSAGSKIGNPSDVRSSPGADDRNLAAEMNSLCASG
jgi:hypothetical protein